MSIKTCTIESEVQTHNYGLCKVLLKKNVIRCVQNDQHQFRLGQIGCCCIFLQVFINFVKQQQELVEESLSDLASDPQVGSPLQQVTSSTTAGAVSDFSQLESGNENLAFLPGTSDVTDDRSTSGR
jgi:hypothetical protein